ncbi:MAG: ABC transporter permease subunit, partial [Bifidobacteriaceae bacterium]|jgi:arabinogalactan oligomer/maltooligosaccharide transport system permease protein|nr:ABC transporter permease subunit [Bifidobacteriaceae bacterium]
MKSGLVYDANKDTLEGQDAEGNPVVLQADNKAGFFRDISICDTPDDLAACPKAEGNQGAGWQVNVGFSNYAKLFTDPKIVSQFAKVLVWTVAFALLSVLTTFFAGLLLALVFNSERLRGLKIYRVILILPYAFPGFMSALLWRNMLNKSNGTINNLVLGWLPDSMQQINWLEGSPWLAKFSVLAVNLWLGYPYMFLICLGALQSLPGEVMESARMDGASPFRAFRSITLPLLFVSVAPLLISSFAFNFNNFNLIYMLTGGGPSFDPNVVDPTAAGGTDILISMVYKLADTSGQPDYGLATALSLVIFIIVGVISAWSFRQTRKLEEVM